MPEQRLRGIHAQRQHLALDRPHRRPGRRRQAFEPGRPGAAREHDHVGAHALAVDDHPAHPSPFDVQGAHLGVLAQRAARREERLLQRQHQAAAVDLMVVRAQHRGGKARTQVRLQPARLDAAQPLELDAAGALELEREAQPLDVVARERDRERALLAVAHADAGGGFELIAERGPQALALQIEREQAFLAGLGLEARRQHAGRGPGRAASRLAALEHGDRAAGGGKPPARCPGPPRRRR